MIIGYCGFSIENYFWTLPIFDLSLLAPVGIDGYILRGHSSERVFEIFMNRIRAENPSI